jgi:anaerobic magnesium-protoporphyrin IX monomethyl ester cyclase
MPDNMKVALIYPPSCDPTAPYLSVPTLTSFLRLHGVSVVGIDANIEAYDHLLTSDIMEQMAKRVKKRLMRLERKKQLSHTEQLAHAALWEAHREASAGASEPIEKAISVLRDPSGDLFFDPLRYHPAMTAVENALRRISAAYTPLALDFKTWRTPFSLLTMKEIEAEASPEANPFHEYFEGVLSERLRQEQARLIGISVAFPGQIQPAYSLAYVLRRQISGVHITVGGPAMTQVLARIEEPQRTRVLGPFDSAVLFEGEQAILELVRAVQKGEKPPRIIYGNRHTDLGSLPVPDFDDMPLKKYFSPVLVLPYDPTRGCYWGKCAFCHYGLSEKGTARYRERPITQMVEHIRHLTNRYACQHIYFSQDAMLPRTALELAQLLISSGISCRWSTDMRPEPSLSAEACHALAQSGALSLALGLESASARILQQIDKGIPFEGMKSAIAHLADAGVATEVMCFTDFPTETYQEALATIRFLQQFRDRISLFMCGQFGLTHGSRVAREPERYGIREIWRVSGDELGMGLFYDECSPSKSGSERQKIDAAIDEVSRFWWFHQYPWAGSLSTAHTQLWYAYHGPDVFRRLAGTRPEVISRTGTGRPMLPQFQHALAREAHIWHVLVYDKRKVTRREYRALCEEA